MKKDSDGCKMDSEFARGVRLAYPMVHKPLLLSRTEAAARVARGVWCSTRETDAELNVFLRIGINSTHAPSPLMRFGFNEMGGNKVLPKTAPLSWRGFGAVIT